MNGTVVELDSLTDTDRTRTENYYFLFACILPFDELFGFVLLVESRIEIRSFRLEFSRAGINHFKYGCFVLRAFLT